MSTSRLAISCYCIPPTSHLYSNMVNPSQDPTQNPGILLAVVSIHRLRWLNVIHAR
ncbi:hypothetical protein M378DRAFT_160051 [Amanita muscaria Koide BX008]|uniref:Uncharacterized protein n=1 Tax=Amanita muscaria (strain Koide BX008) TaxID=946122 RepID=A0A0C2SUJ7_AMAMK|nr:hypothetical protein M378DRAFT_160051 [Amanita muscaria Koide BX008]